METIALTIDGQKITSPAGTSLLEAADRHAIKIPRLCHHPELKPYGACRMCLVEDVKSGRLMAACVTPVAAGLEIQTATERIVKHRRNIVRLMIAEHPESCIVCAKGNRCQLRQAAADLGIGEPDLYPMPNHKPFEEANPFMTRDLSKCILCGKCIRADHELVEIGAIDYNMRGFPSRPATVHQLGLEQSSCTFCGTCLSLCPTGALSPKNMSFVGTAENEAESICGFCGVGCRLTMGSIGNRIVDVNPAHQSDSVNGATLCVRGHFAQDYLNSSRRLTAPLIRKEEGEHKLVPAPWNEALDLVINRLKEIKDRYGPRSIGFLGSSKCTNEENYFFQKLARVCIGTNNVDNGGHIYGHDLTRIFDEKTEAGYRPAPLKDIEKAEVILVLGADPSHSVPVLAYYLKRAARKGIPMIVADPRRTELVNHACLQLPVRPAGDAAMLNGMAALLLEKGAADQAFIDSCTTGFSDYQKALSSFNLDNLCRNAGLEPGVMASAADHLSGKKIAFVVGHGIFQQKGAQKSLDAMLNLSLISGSLGSGHGGIFLVSKENNQQGALDMGAVPELLPGRQSLKDKAVRNQWEQHWKTTLSDEAGLNMSVMIAAAEKGELKALYIMGENPLSALPDQSRVEKALANLDFLVVQDILRSKTTTLAHVVLAGAAMAEKQGTFTNLEGRIQSFEPVVSPPGKAKADWEILARLSVLLENTSDVPSMDQIREEIQQCVPLYAAFTGKGDAWIDHASQKAAYNAAGSNGRIPFCQVAVEDGDQVEQGFPYTAFVGTRRYQLGSGTRTRSSQRIDAFDTAGRIEISPTDADALALANGDRVVVRSSSGDVTRRLSITINMEPGHIFVPAGANGNDAMNLFALDRKDGWKSCAVKIEKAT